VSVGEAARVAARAAGATPEWDAGRSGGRLVVAWQHPVSRLIAPVGLLEHGAETYRFRYLRRAAELPDFQPFLSFPVWDRTYTSPWLFPLFAQRIMSPRRPDFQQFLRQLDLDENATPWEQLARSEGRSSGDTVQVFPIPSVRADGTTTCRLLVHGVRHVERGELPPLITGERLTLQDESDNRFNPEAVLVCTATGRRLGYVPDLLIEHLNVVRSSGRPLTLAVEHVNGAEAPPHLRLLVRLDGATPAGYRPMTGESWATFSDQGRD
jgi:hypothetical protein